jgi:hypothetical protein
MARAEAGPGAGDRDRRASAMGDGRDADDAPTSAPDPGPSREPFVDRLAAWALRGPMAVGLGAWALALLALWVPHYVTWPLWIDIDQFGVLAMGWDRGTQLPYRDVYTYNLPGVIYLPWIIGKVAGWGNTVALYAFDAALVVLLGAAMVVWSRVRLGRALPGVVGYLAYLGYYLNLSYDLVLQRDWHCGAFVALALVALQVVPGRLGRFAAATAVAAALLIRPQAALYLPALALALVLEARARRPGESWARTLRTLVGWGLILSALVALGFVPLWRAGILDDFGRAFRQTLPGGPYIKMPRAPGWFGKFDSLLGMYRVWGVAALVALLGRALGPAARRTALPWIVGLGMTYVSILAVPIYHHYHRIPVMLFWAFNVALLAGTILEARVAPSLRLAAIGAVVLMGLPQKPEFCQYFFMRVGMKGTAFDYQPACYRRDPNSLAAYYPWADYKATLDYLRRATGPGTRVANALLLGVPAVAYPTARGTVFPASSLEYLYNFNRDEDWKAYAEALDRAPADSVAVWVPAEEASPYYPKFRMLADAIRRNYAFERKFG